MDCVCKFFKFIQKISNVCKNQVYIDKFYMYIDVLYIDNVLEQVMVFEKVRYFVEKGNQKDVVVYIQNYGVYREGILMKEVVDYYIEWVNFN